MKKVQDSPPPTPPSSPECPAVKAEMDLEDPGKPTSHHQPLPQPAAADQNNRRPEINPEWLTLIMGYSFAAIGIGIGLQCQGSSHLHLSVSLDVARLGLVFSLAAFVVSKFVAPNFGAQARLLQYVGVFSGVTAFFLAITAFSSLWLKLLSWAIYIISAIAIIISWQLDFFKRMIK